MQAILASPSGGLAKDMAKRAILVTNKAKKNLENTPRRVDTGLLRASIHWEFVTKGGLPGVRIGTNVTYARYIHDGTGIYGPNGAPIMPSSSKYLVFTPHGAARPVFAKQVKGIKPNRFLADALPAAAY